MNLGVIVLSVFAAIAIIFVVDRIIGRKAEARRMEEYKKLEGHPCVICPTGEYENVLEGCCFQHCSAVCKYLYAYDKMGVLFKTKDDFTPFKNIYKEDLQKEVFKKEQQELLIKSLQPTKQEIREKFLATSIFIKYKFNVDIEAIYDKYDNHLQYHNKEHAEAFLYYTNLYLKNSDIELSDEERYPLLIAAYLHDVGHKGFKNKGMDQCNIKEAQKIIDREFKYILDQEDIKLINKCISFTQYPYNDDNIVTDWDTKIAAILRAADMSQIFIKDIDMYTLCYNLHYLELKNEIVDDLLFIQDQYNFYKAIADNNTIYGKYFKLLQKDVAIKMNNKVSSI